MALQENQKIIYDNQIYKVVKVTSGYAYIEPEVKKQVTIKTRFHGDKTIPVRGRGVYISPNAEVEIVK